MTIGPQANARPVEPSRGRAESFSLAAGALLLVEYLLTSYAVDIRPLANRSDWLAMFGSAGSAGPIVLAIATAIVLIGGRRLLDELRTALDHAAETKRTRSPRGRVASLAVHLAAFAGFLSLTISFSQAGEELPWGVGILAVAWVGSVLIAILALVHAAVPLTAVAPIVRRVAPALALGTALGTAAWAGGVATVRFWDPLSGPTLHAAAGILGLAGPDVVADPETVTLTFEGFSVLISPVCSGYEGIGLLTVLMSAYLWTFRRRLRFPHVLALLPVGIGLTWLGNVLRISGLMLVGARWSPQVALGSFHSKAGWVLFCGIALGLVTLTQRTAILSRNGDAADSAATWNPTAAYLAPLLTLVATHMATGLLTDGLPLLYPLGVVAGAAMLWRHRGSYPIHRSSLSWEACAIGIVAFALWIALEPAADATALDVWRRDLASLPLPVAVAWLAFRAFGSVAIVPMAEELAFRGYLLRRLFSADFTTVPFSRFGWGSFLVSSVAYGLLHERWLAGILAGTLFALAQYRRGRLADAVLAHAVANLLLALHAVGWQRWSLWT